MYNINEYLNLKGQKENINNNYVYVDDGIDEIIINKKDISDIIILWNKDLKIYNNKGELIITTIGCFLDRVYEYENKFAFTKNILDRLVPLQNNEILPNKVNCWVGV